MSTLTSIATNVSPGQMEELSGELLTELIEGRLVEKPAVARTHLIARNIATAIMHWNRPCERGDTLVHATFHCFPHAPRTVRRPTVAFIAKGRITKDVLGLAHFPMAPDIAVEVLAPHTKVGAHEHAISDYLKAGVKRVWAINPDQESVRIFAAPDDIRVVMNDAELTDDALLPGFHCALATLFAEP